MEVVAEAMAVVIVAGVVETIVVMTVTATVTEATTVGTTNTGKILQVLLPSSMKKDSVFSPSFSWSKE